MPPGEGGGPQGWPRWRPREGAAGAFPGRGWWRWRRVESSGGGGVLALGRRWLSSYRTWWGGSGSRASGRGPCGEAVPELGTLYFPATNAQCRRIKPFVLTLCSLPHIRKMYFLSCSSVNWTLFVLILICSLLYNALLHTGASRDFSSGRWKLDTIP